MVARGEGPGALADVAVEVLHLLNVFAHLNEATARGRETMVTTTHHPHSTDVNSCRSSGTAHLGDVDVGVGLLQALLELVAQPGLDDGLHRERRVPQLTAVVALVHATHATTR